VIFTEWKCESCGEKRPDAKISVVTNDLSKQFNLPPRTLQRNVNYCNDNPACHRRAIDKSKGL
jgi:hypothetical protein